MTLTENVLGLPEHVSPSQISSYLSCGRKYLLERIAEDVEVKPQGPLIFGSAVHNAIESAISPNDVVRKTFAEWFVEMVEEAGGADAIEWRGRKTKAFPNGHDYEWGLANGAVYVDRALGIVAREAERGYVVRDVEAQFNPVIGGRQFKMRADCVFAHPEGTLVLVDWKTGQSAGDFTSAQLSLYCLAAAEVFGIPVSNIEARVGLLSKDGDDGYIRFDVAPVIPVAVQMIADFTEGTTAGLFPLRPSGLCRSCQVRAACPWGQTLTTDGGDE